MDRRTFMKRAGASGLGVAAGSALGSPALAQERPKITWRLSCAFPQTLDLLFGGARRISDLVAKASGGAFMIDVAEASAGDASVLDAVGSGSVEMGYAASSSQLEKNPAYALGTGVPFGMNVRQQNAWFANGGIELLNEFYARDKLYALPAGNTGTQMGGWYRKEINSVDDLRNLKLRIGGLGRRVIEKLGVVPQSQSDVATLYQALEQGALDAVEFIGPYDDEKLGFHRIAPFYYYPAWWEGAAAVHLFVNLDRWAELPDDYKAILTVACEAVNGWVLAAYDARNPPAIRKLVSEGAQLRTFSQDILQASFEASKAVLQEIADGNPDFKKIYDSQTAFKRDAYLWQQMPEYTFDTFMMIQQRNNNL